MKEHYEKWEPINGLEKELWVESISDDNNGLQIHLRGRDVNSQKVCIIFDTYYIYRNSNDSYRLRLSHQESFEEVRWSLCKTSQSNLINWVYDEAFEIYKKEEMLHYMIKTGEDVMDVITNLTPPEVTILDEKEGGKINEISKMQSVIFRDERNAH
jgi:hypothetical protein